MLRIYRNTGKGLAVLGVKQADILLEYRTHFNKVIPTCEQWGKQQWCEDKGGALFVCTSLPFPPYPFPAHGEVTHLHRKSGATTQMLIVLLLLFPYSSLLFVIATDAKPTLTDPHMSFTVLPSRSRYTRKAV